MQAKNVVMFRIVKKLAPSSPAPPKASKESIVRPEKVSITCIIKIIVNTIEMLSIDNS